MFFFGLVISISSFHQTSLGKWPKQKPKGGQNNRKNQAKTKLFVALYGRTQFETLIMNMDVGVPVKLLLGLEISAWVICKVCVAYDHKSMYMCLYMIVYHTHCTHTYTLANLWCPVLSEKNETTYPRVIDTFCVNLPFWLVKPLNRRNLRFWWLISSCL